LTTTSQGLSNGCGVRQELTPFYDIFKRYDNDFIRSIDAVQPG
jgi:hypothetical protein